MARKRGIPGDRLSRISEELSRASRGDFGTPSKYEEALFGKPTPVPEPQEPPYYEKEEEEEGPTIEEMLDTLDMYSDTFDDKAVSSSSRVLHISFKPDVDVREVLKRAVESESSNIALKEITGNIEVKWVNLKRDWVYKEVTLKDFINFKDAGKNGGSYGKYVNTTMNTFSNGPLGGG